MRRIREHFFIVSLFFVLGVSLLLLMVLFIGLWSSLPENISMCNVRHSEIYDSLFRSLITSLISTCLSLSIGVGAGYCLYRFVRFKKWLVLFLRAYIAVPPVVIGLALLVFLGDGMAGKWFAARGIQVVFNIKGIIAAQAIVNLPFAIVQIMEHFDQLQPRLLQVAETCGATEFILFRRIALPLSKRQIIKTGMTLWSKAMGQFGAVVMIAGVVRCKTLTLPTAIFLYLSSGEIDKAKWVAVVLLMVSLGVQLIAHYGFEFFEQRCGYQMEGRRHV